MKVLDIYVTRHCFGFKEASRLAREIKRRLFSLQVKVIMLDEIMEGDQPDIPATPAYFLNGRLIFLGNPRLEELLGKIASSSQGRGGNYE